MSIGFLLCKQALNHGAEIVEEKAADELIRLRQRMIDDQFDGDTAEYFLYVSSFPSPAGPERDLQELLWLRSSFPQKRT
jgi:hypothetical protein